MIVFSEGHGGTLNAEMQCSRVHNLSRVGIGNVVTVHNSCKDAIPLENWVCICLPACGALHGVRFVHLDARHFGYGTRVRGELSYPARASSKRIRVFMAQMLKEGGFEDAASLWAYAERKDCPRVERPL